MITIPAVIGAVLILVGLALFLVDMHVTNHGLPTAAALLTLLVGGLALFGADVPYSGVLLGAVVVVSMGMGAMLVGILGSLRGLKGRPALTGKDGMVGEVGTVKSPIGVSSEGWVFVHGERWRAVLAFAPEVADRISADAEALIGVGRKVMVVGFADGIVLQVVPIETPGPDPDLDRSG